MADNIQITAGTGTTVASDDVSGVHYQRVKLVDGALDSTSLPGTSSQPCYIGGQAEASSTVPVTVVGPPSATLSGSIPAYMVGAISNTHPAYLYGYDIVDMVYYDIELTTYIENELELTTYTENELEL
jgi:hypothetical protein